MSKTAISKKSADPDYVTPYQPVEPTEPCPSCGNKEIFQVYEVSGQSCCRCDRCGMQGPRLDCADAALRDWNILARLAVAQDKLLDAVSEFVTDHDDVIDNSDMPTAARDAFRNMRDALDEVCPLRYRGEPKP